MLLINKLALILILVIISAFSATAQELLENTVQDSLSNNLDKTYTLNYKNLIAPTAFISFGIISLQNEGLKELNASTRYEISEHQPKHLTLDNYTQYMPAAMVYGLNIAGIKGKHNFRDRTILYASSQLIAAAFVVPLKRFVREERPDGSNTQSFPSGHTTTAFSSAHFLFKEYKDSNLLLSFSGYPFAIFTGTYRMFNDRHWVNDVITGAGFGILSTELAYFLYPKVNKLLSGKNKKTSTNISPFYNDKSLGLSFVRYF